jgi:GntR family transcriptional regulator
MLHNETRLIQIKTIDRFNQEKLYIQLTRIFIEEISSGNWKLNDRIPSEDELCKEHQVSKITVRQAINNLVADGYLMKLQGKGTFVSNVNPVVGVAMKTQFTEEMFGKEVTSEKELLSRGIIEPLSDIRNYLKTDNDIYHFLFQRKINGEPAYIDNSFIPVHMMPEIDSIDLANASFYLILQEKAIKKIFKIIQTMEIIQANGDTARFLDLQEGLPVLAVHRLFFSSDNTPVAYAKIEGRSDRYKFQTEFERIR